MRILELMGMSSTKYGGIERFNRTLMEKSSQNKFIFVYVEDPMCQQYVDDMTTGNSAIEVISNKSVIRYCFSVICLILKFRPHIVHFHFGDEKMLLAPFIKVFFPWIRQITTFHSECVLHSLKAKIKCGLYCRCQSKIVAVSKGVQKEIAAFYDNKKLVTSYLGVECDVSKNKEEARRILEIPMKPIILTTIGFDVATKGFDVLVDAVEQMVNKFAPPPFIVNVVGLSKAREEQFMGIVREKHVESYFMSMGIRNDINTILSASDIYIQPSRTEAISLAIMEALQHGLPVVASNVGGIPEVVIDGKNGLLVNACDAEGLAMAMLELMQSPEKRKEMGERSRKHSLNFNVEKGVENLIDIYEKKGVISNKS